MRIILRGLAAAAALGAASSASAGVYADDLGKCLVQRTTEADKALLIRGMFSALGAHPAVRAIMSQTPEQRRTLIRDTGALYGRLLTSDCRAESVAALKYEGANALEAAFDILGQTAARQLMTDPDVQKEMQALVQGLDMSKLEALGHEAGVPIGPNAPTHP